MKGINDMMKWICVKLAECFNAHLTEEEAEFEQAVKELREAAKAFNLAADKFDKTNPSGMTWVHYNEGYIRQNLAHTKHFRIVKIEASYTPKQRVV